LARSRRRNKNKGRAAEFLFLAGLALLIAGFVARHEIPFLLKHAAHSPAAPAHADIGGAEGVAGALGKLHPPADRRLYAGGDSGDDASRSALPAGNGLHGEPGENQPGEHITGPERRQLNDLIKEKSR